MARDKEFHDLETLQRVDRARFAWQQDSCERNHLNYSCSNTSATTTTAQQSLKHNQSVPDVQKRSSDVHNGIKMSRCWTNWKKFGRPVKNTVAFLHDFSFNCKHFQIIQVFFPFVLNFQKFMLFCPVFGVTKLWLYQQLSPNLHLPVCFMFLQNVCLRS